jgi:hypothetical protein
MYMYSVFKGGFGNPSNVNVKIGGDTTFEGFYKWIKYCCVGKVPEQIKGKARRLVRNLDRTFGKGIVPGRQSASE